MANVDTIVNVILKTVETADNDELARTYNNVVTCGECPWWHDCANEHDCFEYIKEKLEKEDKHDQG